MGNVDFYTEGFFLKIRVLFYGLHIIASFFVFVPVAVMKEQAEGHCPLFLEKKRQMYYYSGAESNCNYPMAVAIIFQLFYGLLRLISLVMLIIGKLTKDHFLFSGKFAFCLVILDVFACLLGFISAVILEAGTYFQGNAYSFKWQAASGIATIGAWFSFAFFMKFAVAGLLVAWKSGDIPCLKGNRQDTTQSKDGRVQREMKDPASESFGV